MTSRARVDMKAQHAQTYQALVALSATAERGAAAVGLDPLLVELVKIRTSQINGCAFCLRLHTRDAVARGETSDRLAVLSAWRETSYFSSAERAALALTETVTLIADFHGVDGVDDDPDDVLTDEQLSAVAWVATVMNTFNRVAITSGYAVHPDG